MEIALLFLKYKVDIKVIKMSDILKKTKLFELPEGTAYSIRITNNTGDYIDLTNYGACILDMYVHTPSGGMSNIMLPGPEATKASLDAHGSALLLNAGLDDLSSCIWDICEETESSVFLSAESASSVKVGIKITWVNLNRLIIDYYLTPKDARAMSFSSRLSFAAGSYEVSAFTGEVNGSPVSDTEYKDMAFVPLKSEGDVFFAAGESIKPMLEVKDTASPLRISLYSTMECAKASSFDDRIEINSFSVAPAEMLEGETLTERVIYGIDYITTNLASDENDPESPFLGFFL